MPSTAQSRKNSESSPDDISSKLDKILSNQEEMKISLSQNQVKIQKLEKENIEIKEKVSVLEENVIRL